MSETDSFINEVTEEVRRDRLYRLMRRYGWIAVLAVLLLVGGAGWNEWRKATERAEAQALGDEIFSALENDDRAARADALGRIEAPTPGSRAMLTLLSASEQAETNPGDAASRLLALAGDNDVPGIYRQIATLRAVAIPESGLTPDERRGHLEGLSLSGGLMSLLAEEQLAMIEVETGQHDAAIERLRQVAVDAGATPGLRRRATQVIVALGGEPPDVQMDG